MAFKLDTAPLAEALRLKIGLTDRAWPEVINKAAKDVTLRTIQFSPVANAAAIAADLERVIGQRTVGKGGRVLKRPRPITKPTTLARAIVLSRLHKKGILPSSLTGAEIDNMIRQMIASRKRSVGYLKSGYLPAARAFGVTATSLQQFGPDHGRAILATMESLFATIENEVPTLWRNDAAAYQRAEQALQQAVDFVEADLLVYVDRKLRQAGFDT